MQHIRVPHRLQQLRARARRRNVLRLRLPHVTIISTITAVVRAVRVKAVRMVIVRARGVRTVASPVSTRTTVVARGRVRLLEATLPTRFRARMRRVRVRAITRSPVSRACTLRLRAIFRARIRWLVRPLKVVVVAVPVVQARARVKAVVDSAVVVRAKAVRAVLVPANGVITVRVRAVPHKAAALAVDSVAAKAAATTSRAAEPRAMVPHVAVAAVVAAVLLVLSAVRAASPLRPVRTVWQSVMSMRS